MQSKKKTVLAVVALVVVVAVFVGVWYFTRPKTETGSKTVTVQLVYDQTDREIVLHTDAAFLRGALEEQHLVQGEESSTGLYVKTVDGRTADDAKQEWWCFTKSGETLMTGVDGIAIADGDHFEVKLCVGW